MWRCVLPLIIVACVQVKLCDGAFKCPPDQIYHQETNKCCYPVFNCEPGTEVRPCNGNDIKDTCTKCKDDMVQPDLVSSLDGINATCFSNKDPEECDNGELLLAREQTLSACGIPCSCNYLTCYYGDDPCRCVKVIDSCPKGKTMNKLTGGCEPCPKYTFKNHVGCGPCYYNETEWLNAHRNGIPTTFPSTSSSKYPKPASSNQTTDDHGTFPTTYSDINECPNNSTIPPLLIAFLVVLIVLVIALSSSLVYVLWKQRRNPPHQLLHQVISANDQTPPNEGNATFSVERQRLIFREERPVAPIQPTHHPVQGGYKSVQANGLTEGEVCNANNVC